MSLILVYGFLEIFKFNPIRQGYSKLVQFNVKSDNSLDGIFDISWGKEGYHVPEFGLLIKGSKGKIVVDDDVVELEPASGQINPLA